MRIRTHCRFTLLSQCMNGFTECAFVSAPKGKLPFLRQLRLQCRPFRLHGGDGYSYGDDFIAEDMAIEIPLVDGG